VVAGVLSFRWCNGFSKVGSTGDERVFGSVMVSSEMGSTGGERVFLSKYKNLF
jgi:hypothetical protein